jgi:hypothetical protein
VKDTRQAVGAAERVMRGAGPRQCTAALADRRTVRSQPMTRIATRLLITGLAAAVAGCASPPSRFYTLSADAPPGPVTSTAVIAVGPVSVPEVVDRPEIVVRTGPNQVTVDEFNRWASPLQSDIARVVAENLARLLGTPRAAVFVEAPASDAAYRVTIDVQRFESAPGEAATLDAIWAVERTRDSQTRTDRTTVREPAPEAGYDAIAAAHSRAVARLSHDIADAVRALQRPAR